MCGTAACKAKEPVSGEEAGTFLQDAIKKWICLHGTPQPKVSTLCSELAKLP